MAPADGDGLSRRRFLGATGGLAATVALAGCGQPADGGNGSNGGGSPSAGTTDDDAGDPQPGGTLELVNRTVESLDPVRATDDTSGEVLEQLFDGLFTFPNGSTTVAPQLATDYRAEDDFTTYRFQLADATFHDGTPVTAADFVYAWERLAGSTHSRYAHVVLEWLGVEHETADGDYVPGTLAVEAEAETVLTVDLEAPFLGTLEMLAYPAFAAIPAGIVSREDAEAALPDDEAKRTAFATTDPVGAGPFALAKWDQGTEVVVERVDDYHGEGPYLDGIHWQIIDAPSAAYSYAVSGKADLFDVPTSKFDQERLTITGTDERGREEGTYSLGNGTTADYLRVPTLATSFLGFNTDAVERPVRRALAYVLDQGQLSAGVLDGRAWPAYHLTPPLIYPGDGPAYARHAEEAYPYGHDASLASEARSLLEDAGYGADSPAPLTLTHPAGDAWPSIGTWLERHAGEVHVDLTVEEVPYATLVDRGQSGDLEAYAARWYSERPLPTDFLELVDPPRTDTAGESPLSYTNWSDTEAAGRAAAAFERVRANPLPTEAAASTRDSAYVTIEEANWEDVVALPVYHEVAERFGSQVVHAPKFGALGPSRQAHNRTWKETPAPES